MRTAIAGIVGGLAGGALVLATVTMLHSPQTDAGAGLDAREGVPLHASSTEGSHDLTGPIAAASNDWQSAAPAEPKAAGIDALVPPELVYGPPIPEPEELAAALRRYELELQLAEVEAAARVRDAAASAVTVASAGEASEGPAAQAPTLAIARPAPAELPVATTVAADHTDTAGTILDGTATGAASQAAMSADVAPAPSAAPEGIPAPQSGQRGVSPAPVAAVREQSSSPEPEEIRALRSFRLTVPKELPKVELAFAPRSGADAVPPPRPSPAGSPAAPVAGASPDAPGPRAAQMPKPLARSRITRAPAPAPALASAPDAGESASAAAQASLKRASDAVKRLSRRMGGGYVR